MLPDHRPLGRTGGGPGFLQCRDWSVWVPRTPSGPTSSCDKSILVNEAAKLISPP